MICHGRQIKTHKIKKNEFYLNKNMCIYLEKRKKIQEENTNTPRIQV